MLWITQIAIALSTMAVVMFGGPYAVLAHAAHQAVSSTIGLPRARCSAASPWADHAKALNMIFDFCGLPWCGSALRHVVPPLERIRGDAALSGAVSAITAAIVDALRNRAVGSARHTTFLRHPAGCDRSVAFRCANRDKHRRRRRLLAPRFSPCSG